MGPDDEDPTSSGLCTCNLTSIQASNASVATERDSRVGTIDRPGLEGGHDVVGRGGRGRNREQLDTRFTRGPRRPKAA